MKPDDDLRKLIDNSIRDIDKKLSLIDALISKASYGTPSYDSLVSAKKELESFKGKVSNESNWRKADYLEKSENAGNKYLLKTGSLGGYTPDAYVKKIVEGIDYKADKSPFKPIVEKYNNDVATESTKGVKSPLNEAALGLDGGDGKNSSPIKQGDKYTYEGKIYTLKNIDGENRWIASKGEKNEDGGKTGYSTYLSFESVGYDDFKGQIENGNAQKLKEFKYSGIDYRYNPTDKKWYDKAGRVASEGITERINELGGFSTANPQESKPKESIAKKGEIPQRYWDAVNSVDSVKPQASKAGEALAKKGLAGAGVTNPTTREVQTEEGVATTKPTLGMTQDPAIRNAPVQPSYSTYNKRGLADLVGGLGDKLGGLGGADTGRMGEVAGYLPDVFKFALGMKGANEKLPEFEVPSQFTDYENRMRELSYQGLTDAELATGRRDLERSYAYDVNAIKNFAGGRPGVALANLGRAASSYQGGLNALNVADAQMQRGNLLNYGNVVNARVGMEQNAFNLKYQEAMNNKMAGAQLAADALSNIQSRRDYNDAYGDNSIYGQYQKSLLEGQEYQNQILKYQLENPLDINSIQISPNVINPNAQIPNYYNTYYGQ